MRVGAHARKGKFHHVRLAHQRGPGSPQAGHRHGIGGGRRLGLQDFRARVGDPALHIKQCFDRHRDTGQRQVQRGAAAGVVFAGFEVGVSQLASSAVRLGAAGR